MWKLFWATSPPTTCHHELLKSTIKKREFKKVKRIGVIITFVVMEFVSSSALWVSWKQKREGMWYFNPQLHQSNFMSYIAKCQMVSDLSEGLDDVLKNHIHFFLSNFYLWTIWGPFYLTVFLPKQWVSKWGYLTCSFCFALSLGTNSAGIVWSSGRWQDRIFSSSVIRRPLPESREKSWAQLIWNWISCQWANIDKIRSSWFNEKSMLLFKDNCIFPEQAVQVTNWRMEGAKRLWQLTLLLAPSSFPFFSFSTHW